MPESVHIPFAEHLQFSPRHSADGQAQIAYEARPEHLNVVMSSAARSLEPAMGMITIELKTSFMRPALGALLGRGEVLHRTRKMAFVQGRVEDAQGQLCAHATGTFKYAVRPARAPAPEQVDAPQTP
jgi:acyl-coenzyme A thioesterase PaaI-like protein